MWSDAPTQSACAGDERYLQIPWRTSDSRSISPRSSLLYVGSLQSSSWWWPRFSQGQLIFQCLKPNAPETLLPAGLSCTSSGWLSGLLLAALPALCWFARWIWCCTRWCRLNRQDTSYSLHHPTHVLSCVHRWTLMASHETDRDHVLWWMLSPVGPLLPPANIYSASQSTQPDGQGSRRCGVGERHPSPLHHSIFWSQHKSGWSHPSSTQLAKTKGSQKG